MNPLSHWNQLRLNQLDELDDLRHRLRNLVRHSRTRRTGDMVRVAQKGELRKRSCSGK